MNYKHIPQDPKDLTLPGLKFKSKARRRYERAMWPQMQQDQLTLMPVEDLAPPQEYCKVDGRVFNLSRIGEWNNRTIWAFYRAVHEDGDLPDHPWIFDMILQWQFLTSDLWRELFSELGKPTAGAKSKKALTTKFLEWASNLTPEEETRTLKEIISLDDEQQWRILRLLMEAKHHRRLVRDEYPKRPVAEDDPFWPAIRDRLKQWCDEATDEQDGEDFYEFAYKLLGPSGMRYFRHFNDGACWR